IAKRRKEFFKERYLPKLRPTPGAEALVRHLRERGHRLVAATSAKQDELDGLLRVCGCDGLLDGATSSDDADSSKPDPDIVQAALKQLGRPAREAAMIGDTPYDVEAAGGAGVATIALRCGGWRDDDLKGAAAIYDDPADLLRHYDESPLARRGL